MLRFNEFAQVFLEALIAYKKGGDAVRFAGLFNYLHQARGAFEQLGNLDDRCLVHRICVLIPEFNYTTYAPTEVDGLFRDIAGWLV